MKKTFLLFFSVWLSAKTIGQAPGQMNYQGVARNALGIALPNQNIKLRLTIRDGSATGTVVYQETRLVKTNYLGMFSTAVGGPGASNVTGALLDVNWAVGGAKFLQVEMDPSGGNNLRDMGASQLLSVPYALSSGASIPSGAAGGMLAGTYPNPSVANGVIGTIHLADNAVTTVKLANGVITTDKIADGSVTLAKLAVGAGLPPIGAAGGDLGGNYPNPVINANAVTTAKIADGAVTNPKLADGAVGTSKLANNAVDNTKIADGSITTNKVVNSSITTAKIADGAITQAKLDPSVVLPIGGAAGGDLSGSYPNPVIKANAVTNGKIADGAVTTAKVADGAIGTVKLTDGSVVAAKLGDGSVLTVKLADNAVTTVKIADANVTSAKLANNAVTSTKIADGSVGTTKLADGSVTSAKLAPGLSIPPGGAAAGDLTGTYPNPTIKANAVTTAKVADGSITSPKLADGSVATTKLADGSVTSAKLAPGLSIPPGGAAAGDLTGTYPNPTIKVGAVTTTKIADNAVIGVKVADGAISNTKLAADAVTTVKIADGSVTAAKLAVGISVPPGGAAAGDLTGTYPNPTIAANAVTTAKVADGSITSPKLADGSVATAKLADGAVTSAKLAPGLSIPPGGAAAGDLTGTYPNPAIAANAVTSAKIADGSVITAKLATDAVTSAKLASNAVTTVKIADGSVATAKLADGAVTSAKLAPGLSIPPGGAAAGDLSGTYPNPAIAANAVTTAKVADGSITSPKLADGSVATAKLADGAVTSAKLAPGLTIPPGGAAAGDLTGTYPNPNIAANAVTTAKLADNSVTTTKVADGAIGTTKIANAAVTSAKIADGSVATAKLADGAVTSAKLAPGLSIPPGGAAAGDLTGTYPNPAIAANAVTTAKVADGSITSPKLADGSVATAKLADGAVTSAKLAPGLSIPPGGAAAGDLSGTYPNPTIAANAVTAAKLADGSVGTTKLAADAVTTAKIADGSITSAKLAAGITIPPGGAAAGDLTGTYPNPAIAANAVTTAKVADGSITSPKLADGSVATAKLADGAVTSAKLAPGLSIPPGGAAAGDLTGTYPNPNIAANAVTTAKLADNSVTTTKVADGAIGTTKIANAAVTSAKIADGSVATAKLADGAVTSAKLAPGLSIPPGGAAAGDLSGTYPNPTIAANAVTAAKLADGSVGTTKLAADAVTTAKIADGSITSAKLAAGLSIPPGGAAAGDLSGTYPNPAIAANAVTTAKIADGSVANAKLAANAVSTDKIVDASVTTVKIADGAITADKLASGLSIPPGGVATGDLDGNYPAPSVAKLKGVSLSATAPAAGEVLTFDGTSWAPAPSPGFVLPYARTVDVALTPALSITNTNVGNTIEGINTSLSPGVSALVGTLFADSPGDDAAGVKGVTKSSNETGFGVFGVHEGTGIMGAAVAARALNNARALWAVANEGWAVHAQSNNNSAGYFEIQNGATNADVVVALTQGTGAAVSAASAHGIGVIALAADPNAQAVFAINYGGGEAVSGQTTSAVSAGILGVNYDVYAGVKGVNKTQFGVGVLAQANDEGATDGTAFQAELVDGSSGNLAIFKAGTTTVGRIDNTGQAFFNGGVQTSGADVAEMFDVEGTRASYEAGDVLEISGSTDRMVTKSSGPYSTLVAGVYATKPGLMLAEKNQISGETKSMVPMGVIGVIPTKVCLEGGAIKRGDLLVTSSIPGVAMKADLNKVRVGQVLGKALQDYNAAGTGKINVLVSVK